MDARKTKDFLRRLLNEREKVIKSIERTRSAESEIGAQKTEDEGDLATISQEKDILLCLHESVFTRLRFIQQGLTAIERGDYGECSRCGEDISTKRLEAVPWARTCISCQEATEEERVFSPLSGTGMEAADKE